MMRLACLIIFVPLFTLLLQPETVSANNHPVPLYPGSRLDSCNICDSCTGYETGPKWFNTKNLTGKQPSCFKNKTDTDRYCDANDKYIDKIWIVNMVSNDSINTIKNYYDKILKKNGFILTKTETSINSNQLNYNDYKSASVSIAINKITNPPNTEHITFNPIPCENETSIFIKYQLLKNNENDNSTDPTPKPDTPTDITTSPVKPDNSTDTNKPIKPDTSDNDNNEPPIKGLISHWKLDEGTGSIVYNSIKNNPNGTLLNEPSWQNDSQCVFGKCLKFIKDNSHISIYFPYSYTNNETSIDLWIKRNKSDQNTSIITNTDNLSTRFSLTLSPEGKPKLTLNENNCGNPNLLPLTLTTDKNIPLNSWHKLTINQKSQSISLYLDGNLIKTENTSKTLNLSCDQNQLLIGDNSISVDDIKIYSSQNNYQIKLTYLSQKTQSYIHKVITNISQLFNQSNYLPQ